MNVTPDHRRVAGRALIACAIGDLLGLPFENRLPPPSSWQAETFSQTRPRWSDDTQQALVLLDDVLRHGSLDAHRVMNRFVAMRDDPASARPGRTSFGLHRGTGRGFRFAVSAYAAHRVFAPMQGRAGNGAAMRVVPVAVALGPSDASITQLEAMTRATHAEEVSWHAALALAHAAWALCAGLRGNAVLDDVIGKLPPGAVRETLAEARVATDPFATIAAAASRAADEPLVGGAGAGHALASPLAALCLALRSPSLHETLRTAVMLGGDTDSTAAMAGALRAVSDDVDALPIGLRTFPGAEGLARWAEGPLPTMEEWWALERDAHGSMLGR